MTINDVMAMEGTGRAIEDSQGRHIVYDRMPHYAERPSFDTGARYMSITGGILMVIDEKSTLGARPLFRPELGTSYWVASFSPDGRRLAYFQVASGRVRLGIYDFVTQRRRLLPGTPNFRQEDCMPVWLGPHNIAYVQLGQSEQPREISERPLVAEKLNGAWQRSWGGKEPSFRFASTLSHSSPLTAAAMKLVSVDVNSGNLKSLGNGNFINLMLAPGGRYLAAVGQSLDPNRSPGRSGLSPEEAHDLWLFDIARSTASLIEPDFQAVGSSLLWSPDGRKLAYFAARRDAGLTTGLFHVFDAASGRSAAWPHRGLELTSQRERGQYQVPERAAWLGDKLAVVARARAEPDAAPLFTERLYHALVPADDRVDWWVLSPTAPAQRLTANFKMVDRVPVAAFEGSIFLIADGNLCRFRADGTSSDLTLGRFGMLRRPITPEDYWSLRPSFEGHQWILESTQGDEPAMCMPISTTMWWCRPPRRLQVPPTCW